MGSAALMGAEVARVFRVGWADVLRLGKMGG